MSLSLIHAPPLREESGLGALSLPGYLKEVTERYGDREALVMHHSGGVIRWSYQDLWDQSLAVARALIACGIGKDTRVGILMTNRPEYLSALFGTAMAGGVAVALSTFSTQDELEHLLKTAEVSVLLYENQVLKKDFGAILCALEPSLKNSHPESIDCPSLPYLKHLVSLDGITAPQDSLPESPGSCVDWSVFLRRGERVSNESVISRAERVHSGDAGGLFFSSGTTSLPKAILHSQRAFTLQFWRWPRLWGLTEPCRSWTGNGFFWSGPMTIIIGTALSTGGALILQPLFEEKTALQLISEEKVTLMNGRPHQWARMQALPEWKSADFSSLQQVTKGEIILEHPTASTDWEMPNAFGTTETMSILSSFVAGDPDNADSRNFGKLLPGNVMKIIDPLSGEILPLGERGEVCIKGPTLMKGYLGKAPEECFDSEGFYHTGDGGYTDAEGHLFWEGRLNDIIKTGGANVSPEEVDTIIAGYPGVKRTQTVGIPHDTLSEMVVACVVPVAGETLKEEALIDYLKQKLASFKVPRRVLFFAEEDYPLTGNEKVKASDLRELASQRLSNG
jgi:acyl-CoA synthetase (AMP-forming)/AMP-acid ligase II